MFWGTAILFSTAVALFYIPTSDAHGFQLLSTPLLMRLFFPFLFSFLLFSSSLSLSFFLSTVILITMKWYLIVIFIFIFLRSGFPGGSVVKNPPANAGDAGVMGLIPGSGRCPRVGNSNLLQYSCLENSLDRGVWWATVNGVIHNWAAEHTRSRNLSIFSCVYLLAIHIFSLEKHLFKSFAHILTGLSGFCCCKSSLCILDMNLLSIIWFYKYFLLWISFSLCWWCPLIHECLVLLKASLSVFPFVVCAFGIMFKISLPNL